MTEDGTLSGWWQGEEEGKWLRGGKRSQGDPRFSFASGKLNFLGPLEEMYGGMQ